jgi:hypothetical protein
MRIATTTDHASASRLRPINIIAKATSESHHFEDVKP